MEELKPRPLDEARKILWYCAQLTDGSRWENQYRRALKAVCDELDRRAAPENKALTLEDGFDITNADGTPIDYEALGLKYKDRLCYCDIDGFYLGQDGQLVLMDDCGETVSIDRGDYHVEARNPEK